MASGIHAVAGIGPITFSRGMPQYRARGNHPMQIPLIQQARAKNAPQGKRSTPAFPKPIDFPNPARDPQVRRGTPQEPPATSSLAARTQPVAPQLHPLPLVPPQALV